MRREGVCLAGKVVFFFLSISVGDAHAFLPTIVMDEVEVTHRFPVIMDVGYYIHILDQNSIKVVQDSSADDPYRTYTGCATKDFFVNFPADISAGIAKAAGSPAGGEWSVTLKAPGGQAATQISIAQGITAVDICVLGRKINLEALTGGVGGVHVADITIHFIKTGLPTS